MLKNKVFIPSSSNTQYVRMFADLGYELTNYLSKADLVCFTGGADVDPSYYKHKAHYKTFILPGRDRLEAAAYEEALKKGLPMVGICRGAQFLHVMKGGTLYQEVDNHLQSHLAQDKETEEVFFVSSTHHQMINPLNELDVLLRSLNMGKCQQWDDKLKAFTSLTRSGVEAILYEDDKLLCYQPHPEFYFESDTTRPTKYEAMYKHFRKLLERIL